MCKSILGGWPELQRSPEPDRLKQRVACAGIPVANVQQAFNGADGTQDPVAQGLIPVDGLHPNDAATR